MSPPTGFEGIDPSKLPTVGEIDQLILKYLEYLYEKDLEKFVLRQGEGRFLIIPRGYNYFAPIIITVVFHPSNEDRALFVNIERRIPISNEKEFIELAKKMEDMFNIGYKELKRDYGGENKEFTLKFMVISAKVHALTLEDPAWFFLLLSRLLKIDSFLLGERKEIKKEEENNGATDAPEFT